MATHRNFSRLKGRFLPSGAFARDFSFYSFAFLTWIPAAAFFNSHVVDVAIINGPSMSPFLNRDFDSSESKDICLIKKWNAKEGLERGMIIALRSPSNPENGSVKRIVALEGDTVFTHAPYPYPTAVVPAFHVWVEGDNPDSKKTLDSHHYGPVSMALITGKVTHVLWPWKSAGAIPWWQYRGRTRVLRGRKEDAPTFD